MVGVLPAGGTQRVKHDQQQQQPQQLPLHGVDQQLQQAQLARSCYVCGGTPARALLPSRQLFDASGKSLPFFPFLEKHSAPPGAERPSPEGCVLACNVCYALLIQQWESYEVQRVPLSKRTYWLKRLDNGPFSGLDLRAEEYQKQHQQMKQQQQVQQLSLPQQHQQRQQTPPQAAGYRMIPTSTRDIKEEPGVRTTHGSAPSNGQNILDLSRPAGRVTPEHPKGSIVNNNTIAYDYSKHAKRTADSPSPLRRESRTPEIPPPRDMTTETSDVCFVCGGQVPRGTLLNIFAKPIANCPFFPSLLQHEKPPRSFPIDQKMGRVKACTSCHAFLLQQWDTYQKHNVPPSERHYQMPPPRAFGCPALPLGALPPPKIVQKTMPAPPTTFVCFTCGAELPASVQRTVPTAPAGGEAYFGFLRFLVPPPGAQPVNAQGFVTICSPCQKNLQRQYRVFEISNVPEHKRNYKIMVNEREPNLLPAAPAAAAPHKAPNQQAASLPSHKPASTNPLSRSTSGPRYVGCYICEKIAPTEQLIPVDTQAQREGGAFFPVIEDLPRPIAAMPMDESARVLLCTVCRSNLMLQWNTFEASGIPYQHRVYQVNSAPSPTAVPALQPPTRPPVITAQPPAPRTPEGGNKCSGPLPLCVQVASPQTSEVALSSSSHAHTAHPTAQIQTLLTTVPTASTSTAPVVMQAPLKKAYYGLDLKVKPREPTIPVTSPSPLTNQQPIPVEMVADHDCFFCMERTPNMYTLCVRPITEHAPFFPLIERIAVARGSPNPYLIDPAGNVFSCSFCYHSLMEQWKAYESSPHIEDRDRSARLYNTHDFICYICGIVTYRKRVRSITVADFPFLMTHPRPGGALQLHQAESVVTCLTCFEGLTSQWREFERLGAPLEMRKYNWITMPPPPEQVSVG
ncbi:hypothetical protein BIW11_01192 [Tropilaelaps mercedesae]|uniref:Genetic suppressor element 1-like n=1 Tax=Tropilaelaps mercedesae TaxID=418985 RepID=A0A1V9XHV8_9ACAR|nr:hypothetical protein BIW11_01192 [Tropilaelaps mercedesae]